MDPAQEEQLRQQKEMQRLEARVREAAARQALPGAKKVEGEAERRMRELYEERLREYGDLATGEEEDADENRCVRVCACVCVRLCVCVCYSPAGLFV